MEDCENAMDQFIKYEEKIVDGYIIQTFYHFDSIDLITRLDSDLTKIARECGGVFTGEQGIIRDRRDIDFEFRDIKDSKLFCERIHNSIRFDLHKKMNVLGQLVDIPTRKQLKEKQEKLKRINCHECILYESPVKCI